MGGKFNVPGIFDEGSRAALNQSQRLFRSQAPVRRELFSQILEGLRTGGIGAQIPLAQRAVSQASAANSQALRGSEASLAASNLTGTPFGQQILAQQRQAGASQVAGIPLQIAQALISGAPGLIGQSANTAAQLSSQFPSGLASTTASKNQAKGQKIGGIGSGLGSLGGGFLSAGGGAASGGGGGGGGGGGS